MGPHSASHRYLHETRVVYCQHSFVHYFQFHYGVVSTCETTFAAMRSLRRYLFLPLEWGLILGSLYLFVNSLFTSGVPDLVILMYLAPAGLIGISFILVFLLAMIITWISTSSTEV